MPRAPTANGTQPSSKGAPYTTGHAPHPNVLKRNQACHQCRRRKLKCDAKRPCSTCVRSHAHAMSHSSPGDEITPTPQCTFDDVAEVHPAPTEVPRNKFERLESRITELEAMLQQKDQEVAAANGISLVKQTEGEFSGSPTLTNSSGHLGQPKADSVQSPPGAFNFDKDSSVSQDAFPTVPIDSAVLGSSYDLDVIWPNWPPNLPGPDLLRHLVEVFFLFHPLATRLFHSTTFMSSLSLPPIHPRFPATPVLHGICAIASLYTAAVTSPPVTDYTKVDPNEIFTQKVRENEERPDSFSEIQARCCQQTLLTLHFLGKDLLEVLQASVLLSWFYAYHSKWVELFGATSQSLRVAVPLGLNFCPPFHSITKSVKPVAIIAPPRNIIDDETRRNTFWLAYAMERQCGCNNGWALCLDDQDIAQLMPIRGDQFMQGALVPPQTRQWSHTKDILLNHPPDQTDSFILYIKSTILISKVKTFNLRFRARHFAGDENVISPSSYGHSSDSVDPRSSAGFAELDHLVSAFMPSFPPHLRPIKEDVVDNHLYIACLIAHVCNIVLHDPHADVRRSGCISALRILTSARAILDLIYVVWSSSFDVSLLDPFASFCWFCGARVLVRFLHAAIEANTQEQIATFQRELEFTVTALMKCGRRIPLAYRLAKLIEDSVASSAEEPLYQVPDML